MANDKPTDLEQLRAAANEDACAILDRIWDYYWEHRRWISAMVLHAQFDMARTSEALRPLGGTVVQTIWEGCEECYMLRFLGVLLCHRGREAEELLIRYFGFLRERYLGNAENRKIESAELEQKLSLTAAQSYFLARVLYLSPFSAGSPPSKEGDPWSASLPLQVQKFPRTGELATYFRKTVMEEFNPNLPVSERDRAMYSEHTDDLDTHPFGRQETPIPDSLAAFNNLDLHPAIRDACGKLYKDGHYRNAVLDASLALIKLVREKSGLDGLDGAKLMQKVFSRDNAILVFNDLKDQSDFDEQLGMMHLFTGSILALRNPRAHNLSGDSPEEALEYIGLLSFLAKRLDEAKRIK